MDLDFFKCQISIYIVSTLFNPKVNFIHNVNLFEKNNNNNVAMAKIKVEDGKKSKLRVAIGGRDGRKPIMVKSFLFGTITVKFGPKN